MSDANHNGRESAIVLLSAEAGDGISHNTQVYGKSSKLLLNEIAHWFSHFFHDLSFFRPYEQYTVYTPQHFHIHIQEPKSLSLS